MYVYIYVYTHKISTHILICAHKCIYVCIHLYKYIYLFTNRYIFIGYDSTSQKMAVS